ncbi:hypothetical protein [Dyella sp. C11]|uniref:hypothetical protein n=1 Tax=Dyella sp. C11 TaxID=2126991 RepID=UPI001300A84D|nr:hypothetical protein [Dyella sp. C11]
MKKSRLALLGMMLVVSGCSTMTPARYSVSVDNDMILKTYQGKTLNVASLDAPATYDANCRLMGPIKASDGATIPQFVQKAFNDEFKLAGVYGDNAVVTGRMEKIAFSSSAGLTSGWWDLSLTLNSNNGNSLSVENKYEFKSGFDAITACNQTAQALGPAVQDLIKKAVSDPRFKTLMN